MSDIIKKQPPESVHQEPLRIRRKSRISGPITFVIVILALIFVMSVFFRVQNIVVEGNTHYTDEEIISAIDIEDGDNLFFFDRFATISRVFAKLPYVEEVSVTRSLPNKVTINVVECKALAYIKVGDEEWTIDHNCKVLGKAAAGEDSYLIAVDNFKPGTLLIGEKPTSADGDESKVDYLSEVLCQIQDRALSVNVKSVEFSDSGSVSFEYGGKFTVVIGNSGGDTEYKFGMLVTVLSALKDGDMGTIDLSDGKTAHFRPL